MTGLSKFPYLSVPVAARWRDAMAGHAPESINPHLPSALQITASTKIASAGSCFAQRLSESLQNGGYNYMITEEGSPFSPAEENRKQGYGLYSARYGNVYTALQLLQLFRRAFERFAPAEPAWRLKDKYVDPFRPAVQSFDSEEECLADRESHLAATRRMFEEVDVFAFTLGLTESWHSTVDGAVFPVCPGGSLGGTFDPARHAYHNFTVGEVVEHLEAFITELKAVNPAAQVILTVSPVPLMATYEPRHVLQATTYSKSILRVAAEEIVRRHSHVHYFASYEIVTATGDSKSCFESDLRSVSSAAVAHVIRCFHQQYTGGTAAMARPAIKQDAPAASNKPMCDEELVMAALAEQAEARQ